MGPMNEADRMTVQAEVERLARTYAGLVHAIIRSYTEEEDDQEDVAQAVWLRVAELWSAGRRPSDEKTWVACLTRNVSREHRRHRQRYAHMKAAVCGFFEGQAPGAGRGVDPWAAEALESAFQKLPERERVAVGLTYYEGFSIEEAARSICCAPGTVKSRLFRARRRLASELGRFRGDWRLDNG